MNRSVKVAIVYYSATGHIAHIAQEMAGAAEKAGAEVRLRQVAELASPSVIAGNPAWAANVAATAEIPVATVEDLIWADAVILGSPTRFGNISSQLKQFLDTLGAVWQQGLLADKVYSGFTSTGTLHGGHESTLLALTTTFHHFGGIVVAPGYTHPAKFADGNPYGTSHHDAGGTAPVDEVTRAAARVQVNRVVRFARAVSMARPDDAAPVAA
ncbi:NAD(P)H:quinone oxidoreductase [Actinoplanes sp. NEAU-A12]|uniref:NAD(P)H:quinone oxidoreductase n=1 Tax=Actinoplanes sandaracinus TaxID=3045177 RepID=A0ABT6WQV1_9ACTN|nr:NAD(P)H:quinone oxidoreductase [Actinoplanes sandaracinus]MDI6102074.1 NAD(P)H:quinone oxidoreductase [Actinoplanes sandaracinus]